ncbi:MAG: response regulator [Sulfuricurvum sp.]|jgi:CheY-like chemotaxis protein|nr:response regulator [Sulfuricurvum sp.]MDP3022358.1 response regulator [Sulfuricurvum sp.]
MSITMAESYFYRNVLVVDDHDINQLLISSFLEEYCNINVEFANNGQEAVDLTHKGYFDLILMDINMPVMDGIEATRIIKKQYSDMPIVAVTANITDENRDQCYLAGMDVFLTKPIRPSALDKVIREYLYKK